MKWIDMKNKLINIDDINKFEIIKINLNRYKENLKKYTDWQDTGINQSNFSCYEDLMEFVVNKKVSEIKHRYFIKITTKNNQFFDAKYFETIEEAIELYDKISNFLKNDERVLKLDD